MPHDSTWHDCSIQDYFFTLVVSVLLIFLLGLLVGMMLLRGALFGAKGPWSMPKEKVDDPSPPVVDVDPEEGLDGPDEQMDSATAHVPLPLPTYSTTTPWHRRSPTTGAYVPTLTASRPNANIQF